MSLFQRNLNKCGQDVTLQDRDIVAPVFNSVDFDESFSNDTVVKGIVSTKRGKTIFDGVATDQPITHKICIKYLSGVTAETWIELKGRKLDIVDVENCCEKDEVLVLRCTERGIGEAAKA